MLAELEMEDSFYSKMSELELKSDTGKYSRCLLVCLF